MTCPACKGRGYYITVQWVGHYWSHATTICHQCTAYDEQGRTQWTKDKRKRRGANC